MTTRCNVQCWDREKVRGNEMKNYLKKSILIHFQIELANQEVQISWPNSARDCTCDVVELLETNDGEGMPQLLVTWVHSGTTLTSDQQLSCKLLPETPGFLSQSALTSSRVWPGKMSVKKSVSSFVSVCVELRFSLKS